MQEQKIWHAGVLGMTLNVDEGRITIFRSTLETLGWPSHYRFLFILLIRTGTGGLPRQDAHRHISIYLLHF